jgi:hypothetical protein
MPRLSSLFEPWFDHPSITAVGLTAFATDHLARLAENNPLVTSTDGAFDAIIAELSAALDLVGIKTSSESIALAVRRARTSAKAKHLARVVEALTRRADDLAERLGKESPAWSEFFPEGLEAVTRMRGPDVLPVLERVILAARRHAPDLALEFLSLRSTWRAIYGTCVREESLVGGVEQALERLRKALMKSALTLANHFSGQPDKAAVYFDTARLQLPSNPVKCILPLYAMA